MIYLFLLVIGLAGTLVPSVKGQDQDKPRSDLSMTLSSNSLMLCVGSALPLNLEIANQGRAEVKIDKVDLWNQFSYGFSGTDGQGAAVAGVQAAITVAVTSSCCSPALIIKARLNFFWTTFLRTWQLHDKDEVWGRLNQ